MAVAVVVGAGAWSMGAAAAHGTTPTTAPAVVETPGTAGMTGMTGMTGMGGSPLTAAANEAGEPAEGASASGLWVGLAAAAAVTALGTGGLLAARRRMAAGAAAPAPARLDVVGAAALLFAGVAHCALTPSHWAEGWHLGAFFAGSGLLLLGQAVLVGLRPSPAAYGSVLASTAVLIVLYFLAREVALPLVDHQDPYLLEDVPVKVAEAVAALVAGVALARSRVTPPAPARVRSSGRVPGLVTSA